MAQTVGQLRLVDQLEPSVGREPAVWRAWDARVRRYVVADLRLPATLLQPLEELDSRLAGVPGLLAPTSRVTGGTPAVVALVEPLRPRRSLAGLGVLPDDVAARVLDDALVALGALHEQNLSLGVITARSLVLVASEEPEDGTGAVLAPTVHLLLSTASASEGAPASARRRDLEQLVDVGVRLAPRPGPKLAQFLSDARRGLRASDVDSAAQLRDSLHQVLGSEPRGPLPSVRPLPALPGGWDELGQRAVERPDAVTTVRERRIRPVDVAVLVGVLVCIVGVLLTSGSQDTDVAAPDPGSTPTAGTSVTTGPDGVATTVPVKAGAGVLASPAAVASLGGPCGFFDVGVIESTGAQQLTCRKQDDGSYVWERDDA